MTVHRLSEYIPPAVLFGRNRLPGKVAANVTGQLARALVPAVRLFSHTLQHDCLDLVVDTTIDRAGFSGVGSKDVVDNVPYVPDNGVWETPGQQLVQNHSERLDVRA